jgi:hypothetical protein
MNSTMMRAAAVAAVLATTSGAADAAIYNLSYTTLGGDILTLDVDGTLHVDGDTLLVNALLNVMFNDNAGPVMEFFMSVTEIDSGVIKPASFSLTGYGSDIFACNTSACNDFFFFAPPNYPVFGAPTVDADFFRSGPSFGSANEAVDPSRYSLRLADEQPLPAVPLPAGGLLLLSGMAGMAALRRKRAA